MKKELKITEVEYREMIKKAEEAGACKDALEILRELSLEEALGHERLPFLLYWYAKEVIKDRWPEAEGIISKDAESSCWYAVDLIKGRFQEAEDTIIKDAYWSYIYARCVINGRWPEAEEIINKKSFWSLEYARNVIKGRFHAAEEKIREDEFYWCIYKEHFGIEE